MRRISFSIYFLQGFFLDLPMLYILWRSNCVEVVPSDGMACNVISTVLVCSSFSVSGLFEFFLKNYVEET